MKDEKPVLYVVSACLAGQCCRFDGGSTPCKEVVELYKQGRARAICPEILSGLPVPRLPCEQSGDRIISRDGTDRTAAFEKGAELALQEALAAGCNKAILKSKSPSCGKDHVYDGTFSHTLVPGRGVWTRKLMESGFTVYDENNLPSELTAGLSHTPDAGDYGTSRQNRHFITCYGHSIFYISCRCHRDRDHYAPPLELPWPDCF